MKGLKVIGFDADDTLWVNEDYYRNTEKRYAGLLAEFGEEKAILDSLFSTEMGNLELFGYGIKPFIISMIENAIRISEGKVSTTILSEIIAMGREMMKMPIQLLPGVKEVLADLSSKYRLIVATKGDLLDQERKLQLSSLAGYFHHIEIMSHKTNETYSELLGHLGISPEEFLMIGNSMRSDILPPYELGCYAIHVPYELTWQYEMDVESIPENHRFKKVDQLTDVLNIIR